MLIKKTFHVCTRAGHRAEKAELDPDRPDDFESAARKSGPNANLWFEHLWVWTFQTNKNVFLTGATYSRNFRKIWILLIRPQGDWVRIAQYRLLYDILYDIDQIGQRETSSSSPAHSRLDSHWANLAQYMYIYIRFLIHYCIIILYRHRLSANLLFPYRVLIELLIVILLVLLAGSINLLFILRKPFKIWSVYQKEKLAHSHFQCRDLCLEMTSENLVEIIFKF